MSSSFASPSSFTAAAKPSLPPPPQPLSPPRSAILISTASPPALACPHPGPRPGRRARRG
eukprot:673859-Pyramimonas_sp.AAC.1